MSDTEYLYREGDNDLAYVYTGPTDKGRDLPTVIFLGGFFSDMQGTKATYLEQQCKERGQAYVRFDYSGHGLSEGEFKDGTIGSWKNDALAIIDHIGAEKYVVVGSSMGGWIALLVAGERISKISGLVGIAAAPDFTRDLDEKFTEEQKEEMASRGYVEIGHDYGDDPYIFTKGLLEEGENQCLLDKEHVFNFPVRLVHGMEDNDVPWQVAFRIKNAIIDGDAEVSLVETGGHSMSREEDLELIDNKVKEVSALCDIDDNSK
jgi:pimeloyl-ACP methyl ester carboxylesterase